MAGALSDLKVVDLTQMLAGRRLAAGADVTRRAHQPVLAAARQSAAEIQRFIQAGTARQNLLAYPPQTAEAGLETNHHP